MRVSKRRAIVGTAAALVAICAVAAGMAAIRARTRPPEMSLQERFLAGVPCAPPCWEGITPGVTTAVEAERRVRAQRSLYVYSVKPKHTPPDETEFGWQSSDLLGTGTGYASFEAGTISDLYVQYPAICLGEIIEAYGEPDCGVSFSLVLGPGGDDGHRAFRALWVEMGFQATFYRQGSIEQVSASLCGADLEFFPVGRPPDTDAGPFQKHPLTAWHGYDSYEAYLVSEGGCGE